VGSFDDTMMSHRRMDIRARMPAASLQLGEGFDGTN
jgi:hypothetical protein